MYMYIHFHPLMFVLLERTLISHCVTIPILCAHPVTGSEERFVSWLYNSIRGSVLSRLYVQMVLTCLVCSAHTFFHVHVSQST